MRRSIAALSTVLALAGLYAFAGELAAPAKGAPAAPTTPAAGLQTAVFGGGCFWCMESPFEKLDGVTEVLSGYAGGKSKSPTYEEVSSGGSGHVEVVQVTYDPKKVSYEKLLEVYWVNVDPTVKDRQFCDKGSQYRSAIFPADEAQKAAAVASKEALEKTKPFRAPIVTEIESFDTFWPAEEYHQDYYKKNPLRYRYYRNGCGRDKRLKELWGSAAAH